MRLAAMACMVLLPFSAHAERLSNPVAEFIGMDKITGRITTFDVYLDETVQFGALQVTPHVCFSSSNAEEPKTDSFVAVDEITLDRKIRRIFTGWMFAESPGLNAVEHPIYDVWLKGCKEKSNVPMPKGDKAAERAAAAAAAAAEREKAAPAAQPSGPKAGDELGPSTEKPEDPNHPSD